MIIAGMNLTETRAVFLSNLASNNDWVRRDGHTLNWRSDRKMPEPTYCWLVENALVDCDCGNLNATPKGVELLNEYRRRRAA